MNNDDNKLMEQQNQVPEENTETAKNREYWVNIEGEDVKVDCDSDEEYNCLLNCLEGYYIYGIGRDDDEE